MAETSTTTLTMKRTFEVPAKKVFEAWTTEDLIKKWFFTMDHTNKVAKCDPRVGGTWEIVDHREGTDYRAIGEYLEVDTPSKLVLTFEMPQFSDTKDIITVEFEAAEKGCEMTFTQGIVVPHEDGWTQEDLEKALGEYHSETEQGWHYMFLGLKELVETGKINYPSF